jgi:hypothetical protein
LERLGQNGANIVLRLPEFQFKTVFLAFKIPFLRLKFSPKMVNFQPFSHPQEPFGNRSAFDETIDSSEI